MPKNGYMKNQRVKKASDNNINVLETDDKV